MQLRVCNCGHGLELRAAHLTATNPQGAASFAHTHRQRHEHHSHYRAHPNNAERLAWAANAHPGHPLTPRQPDQRACTTETPGPSPPARRDMTSSAAGATPLFARVGR
ncbi:uncharacterized protein VDAG_03444 [Verticillium dahliae VdLs.17]|uniref:Uncharacterized protein n=1 Tax=Verticillium dahliae (strain VdLs.17 / ATCC MYA-4575 / FGSC 10137) TaxID=498257 RepID=G2WZK2_VERDV|nr:uncharacterized protein VDAG_03444 [Verticillium dahliae VdLs.17]EGY22004.1 hypothetical protein VDAG_03444 [Verticillium dahliae VdLs.17]